MPRPKKCRRICGMPKTDRFGPAEPGPSPAPPAVEMTLDEYEVLRLIDLLDCTQEECALQMEVARTTVQAVYNCARKKLADALVNGKQLVIRGGRYALCPHAQECCGKNCGKRRCTRRCCEKNCGGDHHEDCSHL